MIVIKPTLYVFAGPNGSGKSTFTAGLTKMFNITCPYINADDIARVTGCSVKEAADKALEMKNNCIQKGTDFAFETVLSSYYNLEIIRKAKEAGFFIYCFYVITRNPEINIQRVKSRAEIGGHDVPEDKIVSRYYKALDKMKEVLPLCDIVNVYDNSITPYRIFKKRKDAFYYQDSELWSYDDIYELTTIEAQERDLNRF